MNRSLPRRSVAALFLSLLLSGALASATGWTARVRVCPDGTTVTSPSTCPPPPGTWAR